MQFIVEKGKLILNIDNDGEKKSLQDFLKAGEIDSDKAMFEFFEDILANCEWEWIAPYEIAALTDAPILGRKDENDEVIEAYGWMDYAVTSLLAQLYDFGHADLIGGTAEDD